MDSVISAAKASLVSMQPTGSRADDDVTPLLPRRGHWKSLPSGVVRSKRNLRWIEKAGEALAGFLRRGVRAVSGRRRKAMGPLVIELGKPVMF
jgi:hypothetical protein